MPVFIILTSENKVMAESKQKGTIGFQANAESMEQLDGLAETLEVEKSVIARTAYSMGLRQAVALLKEERMRKVDQNREQLSALIPQALHVLRANCIRRVACR